MCKQNQLSWKPQLSTAFVENLTAKDKAQLAGNGCNPWQEL